MLEVNVQVRCEAMPDSSCTVVAGGQTLHYEHLQLGLQLGEEVVQTVSAGGVPVAFEVGFRVALLPDGTVNFLGPAAKGTPRERFFYLVWRGQLPGQPPQVFRRAKIHLSHLSGAVVMAAAQAGLPLQVIVPMTDSRGEPRCASVRPPVAIWETAVAG